ncbi:hypothetical protein [Sedimentisphaera salicampi]|uniref:Transposase n=1 Tax=Sedimentisphaera salicampi TaxID=1941349 RepID=A0A1W6LPG7_9BACT|nr:hypothetical protein [Sedimentisphaera salicampi]ARN56254.1 hypothetical protein STSP1_00630 [Sedimentisphaera salicampi]ARN56458.1 hypothetical protein STSP1_00840 [Sedimentisphaera salicampi]ARN57268.1 hypothetical protein STSP1_01671 [Sedimentisphaera salicampi]ARN57646.1 hypothetical protein STSP1_02067 [Sedimentisphaera salicampi]
MKDKRPTGTRYSEAFKLQVVNELESGKLSCINEANIRYGIAGSHTVKRWLKKYGRNHLIPKRIRVERPDEHDRLKQLKAENKELKEALADAYLEKLVSDSRFEVTCEQFGLDSEEVKKKLDTKRHTRLTKGLQKRKKK